LSLVIGLAGVTSNAAVTHHGPGTHIRIGSLELTPCGAAFCGRLQRPLDPGGLIRGEVSIHFEFYPHANPGRASGTLVATEGGPGYPATESRADYLALFRPLMANRDVLLMDNRGTGQSGAVDCHELQSGERWSVAAVAACGTSLGERAALYGTALATDDLAALLAALHVARIDLYGDSYGTYFEQVFAVRHPAALRSVVLDGAYPLNGADYAWYPRYAPAMRDKFNIICARSAACAALPGDSIAHIMPALYALRARPFAARATDVDGTPREFRADASRLAIVMFGSAPAFTTATELDAAARAFVVGDQAPLLRLMAETVSAVDSRDPSANPAKWSAGLAAAVMCQDPPQIFDMRLAPAQRALDRDRAVADRTRSAPDTYAPFTIDEYRAMPLDYSFLDQCVAWPVAPPRHPASQVGIDAIYPDVPALVISGELDNMTTMADGAAVAAAFKRGEQVRIANSFHVNALPRARSSCAAGIVRRFITTTTVVDAACASRVPPLRLVPQFAMHYRELSPAAGLPGNQSSAAQLQAVTAAVRTIMDVLARAAGNTSGHGAGLRGGTFRVLRSGPGLHLRLDRVRWANDIAISGSVEVSRGRAGAVRATLQVTAADASDGRLALIWPAGLVGAAARISGKFGAARVVARSAAP
jgi:pimeloyl-ACP methyl ester carboxylesterase